VILHEHDHTAGPDAREHLVKLVPLFSQLGGDEIREIAQKVRPKLYRRNEQVYRAGDRNSGLLIIHSGRVKIYRISENGHEQLIRALAPGDFTGEMTFITDTENDDYAITLEESEICSLHHDDLRNFVLKYPTIAYTMLQTLSERLQRSERLVGSLTGDDAERRIASYLVALVEGAEDTEIGEGAELTLPLSKKDLASYLGTTPETLSRKLAKFEAAGWILLAKHGQIAVLDLASLSRV
jgi:CRP-like cAMP-binding protein